VRFSLATGLRGQLNDSGAELIAFVDDLCDNGYAVSRKIIIAQACMKLVSDFSFFLKVMCCQSSVCFALDG
jgi:hypothetical protein